MQGNSKQHFYLLVLLIINHWNWNKDYVNKWILKKKCAHYFFVLVIQAFICCFSQYGFLSRMILRLNAAITGAIVCSCWSILMLLLLLFVFGWVLYFEPHFVYAPINNFARLLHCILLLLMLEHFSSFEIQKLCTIICTYCKEITQNPFHFVFMANYLSVLIPILDFKPLLSSFLNSMRRLNNKVLPSVHWPTDLLTYFQWFLIDLSNLQLHRSNRTHLRSTHLEWHSELCQILKHSINIHDIHVTSQFWLFSPPPPQYNHFQNLSFLKQNLRFFILKRKETKPKSMLLRQYLKNFLV